MSKPFVSFIVMSYKAEKFIQEAIDGALAQTYDNLEIIFSDDASPDKTFEIIEENVKNYTGKHKDKISIYGNEKNLGIGAHLNKLWWEIAKGDWIVVSAGDDVSLPNRVEKLMEYASEDVSLIHHYSYLIDEKSNVIPHIDSYQPNQKILENGSIEDIINKGICVRGGTMCLNKKMLNLFGPFNKDIINEDIILAYRARFYGKIIHLDEKLMSYREHDNSISYNHKKLDYKKYVSKIANESSRSISIINQILKDNEILKLSNSFINKLLLKQQQKRIDNFLYGKNKLHIDFFTKIYFYKQTFKRLLLKPYLKLKHFK